MSKKSAQDYSSWAQNVKYHSWCALSIKHQEYIWLSIFMMFITAVLCLPRLHSGPLHRRLLGASSEDVIEDPCDGLFQICDAM